jgi:alpha-tubulin suppressor-like RCC1 family protein
VRGLFAIAIAVLVCSCDGRGAYVCASSDQCVSGGAPGVCEPSGFCSFGDPSCEGGRRYESNAGDDLGGACVQVEVVPPVEVCGAVSQACCQTGPACGGNGRCSGGTCASCVTDVALGRHAVCVLKHDGTVWCAGENAAGQLGSGMVSPPVASWTQVLDTTSAPIADATAIATHGQYACAVRAGGTVWCWGEGFGPLAAQVVKTDDTPLTNIVEIDGGYCHRCARDDAGGVWCWGCNFNGHLGDGTTTLRAKAAPVLDAPLGPPMAGALSLTVGNSHACVRKAGDAVWCWGRNTRGHLGDTTLINRLNPVMVTGATAVTAGQHHTCSLRADGTVWCSGDARRNRIGNGIVNDRDTGVVSYPTPVQVVTSRGGPPLTNVTQIAAGGVSCALVDKTVHCWGDNRYGETGTGAASTTPRPVLTTDRKPLTGIERIVAHGPHACAFRDDGELLCWGRGIDGVFGDGTLANRGLARPLGFTCP